MSTNAIAAICYFTLLLIVHATLFWSDEIEAIKTWFMNLFEEE